jgi:hypothetical protein
LSSLSLWFWASSCFVWKEKEQMWRLSTNIPKTDPWTIDKRRSLNFAAARTRKYFLLRHFQKDFNIREFLFGNAWAMLWKMDLIQRCACNGYRTFLIWPWHSEADSRPWTPFNAPKPTPHRYMTCTCDCIYSFNVVLMNGAESTRNMYSNFAVNNKDDCLKLHHVGYVMNRIQDCVRNMRSFVSGRKGTVYDWHKSVPK